MPRCQQTGVDPFDDCGIAAHLSEPTRRALQASYGRFLGFVSSKHPHLLNCPPETRPDRNIIADYVAFRRQTCSESGIAIDLHHLRLALGYICRATNWSWLLTITKRIAATAKPKPQKHQLVTSERLYASASNSWIKRWRALLSGKDVSKVDAFKYRDGLLIGLLALITLRRRTLSALCVGQQLVQSGNAGVLTSRRRSQDATSSRLPDLVRSVAADRFVPGKFRGRIPGAAEHDGLWPSNKGRPMDAGTIYDTVRRRTHAAFGFPVNLHRFQVAAGTLPSMLTRPMCEALKTCLVIHHSIGPRSITSCHTRALRGVSWLGPSAGTNRDAQSIIRLIT